jgi:hypothetical protein
MLFFLCSSTPSIASVIPAMDHLNEHLASAAVTHKYDPTIRVGLYAVTVSTAQRHPYDGYRTRTVES